MKRDLNYNKKNNKLKTTILIGVFFSFAILFFLTSIYLFNAHKKTVNQQTPKIDYALSGKADYVVKLKENDYYNSEYLKSDMQYIASLIKSIDINFKYEAHASENLHYKYKYDVNATTIVTSKNDSTKVLFEKSENLVNTKIKETDDTNFVLDGIVSIDYDKYNDYILNYKKEYLLNSSFDLIVTVHVETTGKSDISSQEFRENANFEIVIPLSEQIIDITKKNVKYQTSGLINGEEQINQKTQTLYYTSFCLMVCSLMFVIVTISLIINKSKIKSKYNRVINKYLKEYDRAIVTTNKSKIHDSEFDKVIEISSMDEMLDLHDNFQLPILYYEMTKNELSYFVIIKDNILYKLVISKKLLEESEDK